MNEQKCLFCNDSVNWVVFSSGDGIYYKCEVCGEVLVTDELRWDFRRDEYRLKMHLISGYTRYTSENGLKPELLTTKNINGVLLSYFVPRNFNQHVNLILQYVAKTSDFKGADVCIHVGKSYPIAFAKNAEEFRYYLEYLKNQALLKEPSLENFQLTPEGWNRIDQLQGPQLKKSKPS
jgi:hypothetical protein